MQAVSVKMRCAVFVCSSPLFDVYHTHTRRDVGLFQGFCKSSEHH